MQRYLPTIENSEKLRQKLKDKFKLENKKVSPEEKIKLATAIRAIQYPYAIKDILVYLTKKDAALLTESTHALLKYWGDLCMEFYNNSKDKRYIVPETGIVSTGELLGAQGGVLGSMVQQRLKGHGVWNIALNQWVPSPNSYCHPGVNFVATIASPHWFSNPVSFYPSQTPIDMISPIHIAALIGDIQLMQELLNKGWAIDFQVNKQNVTPLELAMACGELETVSFILDKYTLQNKKSIFVNAIKNADMNIIEKIFAGTETEWIKYDEIFTLARKREEDLFEFLTDQRNRKINELIRRQSPLIAFESVLNYTVIPVHLLVDFIVIYPELIQMKPDGNPLLHSLVIKNENKKVQALLEAIFLAGGRIIPNFSFDIDTKNAQGKTVLALAGAAKNKEIISAIFMYFSPTIDDDMKAQLAEIDIPNIKQKKDKISYEIMCKTSQTNEVQTKSIHEQGQAIVVLEKKIDDTTTRLIKVEEYNEKLISRFENQSHQMALQAKQIQLLTEQVIMQQQLINQLLGLPVNNERENIAINNNINREQLLLLPADFNQNPNLLFAVDRQPINNQVVNIEENKEEKRKVI